MKSKLKQLGQDSLVYGLGGVVAKGIGFFLLPVYTRIFSPADYGTIEMLNVIISFVAALLVMGMDSAQSFYFFEQKDNGKSAQAKVVTGILQWRLTWGMLIVGGALLLSPLINEQFFQGQLTWIYFAIAFIGIFLAQLTRQSAEVFRLLYRPWSYIGISLGSTLLSAAIALTLIIWLDWGILAVFTGTLAASALLTLVGWSAIRDYVDWSGWHREWWPRLLKFGAPLVPASVAMYVLNTADRWFISHYHGPDMLGLYAVGAKFALLLALAITTFRQAWWPVALDAMHSSDGPQLFRTIARLYLGLGSAGIVLLTALSPWLVKLLTAPAYHAAYPIVGVLAWHSLFFGFYLIGAAGIWKKEKTAWAPIGMGIAAVLNIGLDFWLVPRFGALGAAAATSISFFVWNVLILVVSERLWPVGYPFGVFGLQIGIGVAAMTGILTLYSQNGALWQIMALTAIAMIILIGLSIERSQLKVLFSHLKKPL